ncbi:uncharacterized protein [Palaemon carinicauda]|uniref:uncharacterized protein n=1 Tax=Palaemon carinicauda TaxID=392227 RepID=UPI0035B68F20
MDSGESCGPDFLINQSSHTCLTVITGSGPKDAVIGMSRCTGGIKQQWFARNGQWHWGGNQALCLSRTISGKLCLAPHGTVSQSWFHDEQDRLVLGSDALDVPWQSPRTRVVFYPLHSGVNQKWWTLSQLQACLADRQLTGEHCLAPNVLEICKKEIDRCSSVKTGNLKSSGECLCQVGKDFLKLSATGEVLPDAGSSANPDYLINQSTLTCLTVLSGTGPSDAKIGLAPFTGTVTQQWIIRDSLWLWAGNPSCCLVPNWMQGNLMLGAVSNSRTQWLFNDQEMLETNSNALDVPWDSPRTKVIVYPKHGGVNQKWWRLSHVKAMLQSSPEKKTSYPAALVDMTDRIPAQSCQCNCQGKKESRPNLGMKTGAASEEPEYLISQSTHTCLTVLNDSNPNSASIGLAPYTGDSRQQWFVKGGIWEWAQDRSYYLAPDVQKGILKLTSNKGANMSWNIDQNGLFMNGSLALDVPWEGDRTRVILYPKHGHINQRWWRMSSLKSCVGCKLYPLSADEKTFKEEVARGIVNHLCPLTEPLPHPRDVDHYPGTVAPGTPRKTLTWNLTFGTVQQRSNLRMTVPEDWQATNMYVVAGDIFTVTLPGITEKQAEQITVRVGAHRDCLSPTSPNLQKGAFKRMPVVSEEFDINPGANRLRSQFGGNLIFMHEGKEVFRATAEVRNVVETPHYILGKSNSTDWENMKRLDAPFCVLETDKVVLIAPTSEARGISDIVDLLHRYDDIMTKLEELSGFNPSDPPPKGKQWMVDDVQITAGSAHAGFPAMFDHQYYDLTSPETPHDWVVWHELGHNYQQGPYWSYAYGIESTVNLFSLYIEEKLKADDRLKRENRYLPAATAVDNGLTFEQADCWQKLVFLMEIKHAFPSHGWNMYVHLNRSVRALSEKEASVLKSNLQNQYDYVYVTLSRFLGTDLLPHYERWSLPVSERAQSEVRSLGLPKVSRNISANSNPEQYAIA